MRKYLRKVLSFLCAIALLATSIVVDNLVKEPAEVKAATKIEPISVDGYENVTISNLVDSSGNIMPEKTYSDVDGVGTLKSYSLAGGKNLNGKLLSMKVKFTGGGGNARMDIGGIGDWSGFSLYASKTANYLHVYTNYSWASQAQGFDIPASVAGLTSVLDTEFILQMSIKYIDDATDCVEVGVYINGVLCNTCTITGVSPEKFGGYVGLYCQDVGQTITVSSVEWPAEPVQLEGFGNLTLKDFGMPAGEYEGNSGGGHSEYTMSGISNLDKKLLSMKILYGGGDYKHSLIFGGNGGWCGFNLHPSGDGNYLFVDATWAGNIINKEGYAAPTMSASVADLSSFIGKEFLLQMSFEYSEPVDGKSDLTLGVYINGKLYNNEKFVIQNCNVANLGSTIALYREVNGSSIIVDNVQFPADPVYLDGFTNITVDDFIDASGNPMQETTYSEANSSLEMFSLKNYDTFNKKLFSVRVKFNPIEGGNWATRLDIGGNGDWNGITVRPNADGGSIAVGDIYGQGTGGSANITKAAAKVLSMVDNEFLLQMSFAYGEEVGGKADITIGIYIDGALCTTHKLTNCDMSKFGKYIRIYREQGSSITLKSVDFEQFYGYNKITVDDFEGLESKAYAYNGKTDTLATFYAKGYENFDNTVVSMRVKYNYGKDKTRIDLGGVGDWSGLMIYPSADGSYLFVVCSNGYGMSSTFQALEVSAKTAGVSSFLDKEFLLQVTFDYKETDVEVGVYINGTLYNNEKKTFTGCNLSKFGNSIGLYREVTDSIITVANDDDSAFPSAPLKQPNPDFTKLTFGHFGLVNKKYPAVSGDVAVQGKVVGRDILDKTVICGDILYEGSNSSQIIWGGKSGWDGLRMFPKADGTMSLSWYKGNTETVVGKLDSSIAGVSFVGEKYNIMLSSALVDADGDGNANDIQFGIWFNGVLYNQEYFFVKDKAEEYGNSFSVYCAKETDSVTLGNVIELLEQPSDSLKKITFFQYGIEDGTYESAADINTKGSYKKSDSVAGTVLCGDIQIINGDKGEIDIFLGSKTNVWEQGVRLTKYGAANDLRLIYQTPDTYKEVLRISTDEAGVDFTSEKFNLMWSMEMVDSDSDGSDDDLKIGIWFNGFLYKQAYVYVADFGVDMLGNVFSTYCGEGTAITLNSIYELTQLPDKSFEKITFSDFGLESGKIVFGDDVVGQGKATAYSTLDRVVFSGDFRFSDAGDYQIIYGGDGGWSGLRLMIESTGNLNGSWYKGNDSQLVIWGNPGHLGLNSLTQETFNLTISTELVDDDGDGQKNDIKVGVWFNNVLYEYEGTGYHIVKDWGDQLKNGFSIYGAKGASTNVLIRNVAEYQANRNYFEDISSYRGEKNTAPELENYVFAGWYEDAEYTVPIESDVTSGNAWAKYVEEDVLAVKAQVKTNAFDENTTETSLRLLTTVDSLQYSKVAFYVEKKQEDGSYGTKINTASKDGNNGRKVYRQLYAIGSTGEKYECKPSIFSWMSEYFKAFVLNEIPKVGYDTLIRVTPYVITLDGTEVLGQTRELCVNDYKFGANASKAVSVDFLGAETMPITGYHGPSLLTNADTKLFPNNVSDQYFKMIADAGVNVIIGSNLDYKSYPNLVKKALQLGEKYGIAIFVKDTELLAMATATEVADRVANYANYKAFAGMYIVDEPGTDSYLSSTQNGKASNYTTITQLLEAQGIMCYANMYPIVDVESNWWEGILGSAGVNDLDKTAYNKYIQEFSSALDLQMVSYDYYPFDESRKNNSGKYDMNLYFWNMDAIRTKAKETQKPFWAFVQAGSQWNDAKKYFESSTYYPSEGQFNWNMNTALAFGAQGIQYFPLIQPYHFAYGKDETHWDFERNGLISTWGSKTRWYGYAEKANAHVAEIDSVLMKSVNEQVIAIGTARNDMSGISCVTKTATYNNVLTDATGNALIGCFNYCGKTALYVVNYDYDNAGTVTLTFDTNRDIAISQNAETTKATTNSVTLSMAAGEGVLLVIE